MAKNRTGLLIVVILVPVVLACLVTAGAGAIFWLTARGVATVEPQQLGPTPWPADPIAAEDPNPVAPARDPRDVALAQLVNDAATAMLAAARGLPHDARWDGSDPNEDLRGTSPDVRTELLAFGSSPEIVMSVPELEATTGASSIRSQAAIFPDGRLRWLEVDYRTGSTRPTDGLAAASPQLEAGIQRMIEALRSGNCDLPRATQADLTGMPPQVVGEALQDLNRIDESCTGLRNDRSTWLTKVDDLGVVLRGNGQVGVLSGSWTVAGGRLVLHPVRFRPFH